MLELGGGGRGGSVHVEALQGGGRRQVEAKWMWQRGGIGIMSRGCVKVG